MKLIGRTAAILLAALLVAGATWAIVRVLDTAGAGVTRSAAIGGPAVGDGTAAAPPSRSLERGTPGGPRGERGNQSWWFGLMQIGQHFALISVIVLIVQVIVRFLPGTRRAVLRR